LNPPDLMLIVADEESGR